MIEDLEDLKIIKSNLIKLLDKDKLVVLENEYCPVSNDCRLERYKLK